MNRTPLLHLSALFVLVAAACSKPSETGVPAALQTASASAAPPPPSAPSSAPSPSSTVGTGDNGGGGKGGGADAKGSAAPLKVVVTGGTPTTWSPDAFAGIKQFTIHSDGSEKGAWSLREITHQLVGPKARVVGAVDGDGTKAKINPKDWADAKKTPVLRINRRGMYKIEWVDKDGNMTNDDDVRDVKSIEVTPGG
jgi:hypothetical protein